MHEENGVVLFGSEEKYINCIDKFAKPKTIHWTKCVLQK